MPSDVATAALGYAGTLDWDGMLRFSHCGLFRLGQQVSIAAARVLVERLVERCGDDLAESSFQGLSRVFSTLRAVIASDLSSFGMPSTRAGTLKTIAETFLEGRFSFKKGRSPRRR
jgi:3-methyladenine DNA glycosylase/8-oxoguanine DNA glycosylase